jgi:hypothetical protein
MQNVKMEYIFVSPVAFQTKPAQHAVFDCLASALLESPPLNDAPQAV